MLHSTNLTELSPGFRGKILEAAEQLDTLDPSDDPLTGYFTATDIIGVSDQSIRNWVQAGYIPHEKVGNKHFFRTSVIKTVQELRALHGRQWYHFVPWETGKMRPPPRILTRAGREEVETVEETPEVDMELVLGHLYKRLTERATSLRDEGKTEAACELLFLATEVIAEIEGMP